MGERKAYDAWSQSQCTVGPDGERNENPDYEGQGGADDTVAPVEGSNTLLYSAYAVAGVAVVGGLYWAYVKFIRAAPTQEDGEDDTPVDDTPVDDTASVHTNATGSTDGTTVTDPTDGGNANTTPGPTDGPTVGGNVNVLPPLAQGTYVLHRGILHRVSGDNNELTRHD